LEEEEEEKKEEKEETREGEVRISRARAFASISRVSNHKWRGQAAAAQHGKGSKEEQKAISSHISLFVICYRQ
jgi:hypothetical protein